MANHALPQTSTLKRTVGAVLAAGAATALLGAGIASAEPAPPTNGGNGAGSSGQCTGPAGERPTSCQSPGGVSDR
jgi:hypothetical protein